MTWITSPKRPEIVRDGEQHNSCATISTGVVPYDAAVVAGTSAAFGHSHHHEYLHTSGARCDARGQQSSGRNGSSEKKSGMKMRGGKKAALAAPGDAKSFRFRPTCSS